MATMDTLPEREAVANVRAIIFEIFIDDRQRRLRASSGIVDDLGKKWTI